MCLRHSGCGPPSRQTSRCIRQLQRCARSPHEEHTSLAFANRELCIFCLITSPTVLGPSTVGVASLQHAHQVTHTTARLPEQPEPRHSQSRSYLFVRTSGQRTPNRSAAFDDGGGTTYEYVHTSKRGSHRSNRANHQRTRRDLRATSEYGL